MGSLFRPPINASASSGGGTAADAHHATPTGFPVGGVVHVMRARLGHPLCWMIPHHHHGGKGKASALRAPLPPRRCCGVVPLAANSPALRPAALRCRGVRCARIARAGCAGVRCRHTAPHAQGGVLQAKRLHRQKARAGDCGTAVPLGSAHCGARAERQTRRTVPYGTVHPPHSIRRPPSQ